MVGDRRYDVIGAHANRMRAIGVLGAMARAKSWTPPARTISWRNPPAFRQPSWQ